MDKQTCYCSFCKNERVYIKKRHISFKEIMFAMFSALLLNFIFWQKLDPRLMFFFASFCFIGEVLNRIRWRLSLVCSYCGFDPILYLKDPQKMSLRVKDFMQMRKSDPSYYLSAKTLDKLPKVRRTKEEKAANQAEA